MLSRRHAWTLLRLILTIVLLAWLFSRVDIAAVAASLRQVDPRYLAPVLLLYLAAILANTAKWQLLLRALDVRVPWGALLRYTFLGLFFNNLLPTAVGGDAMRGLGLARYTQRRTDAAVSVVVDRLIGLLTLTGTVLLTFVYLRLRDAPTGAALAGPLWAASLATAVLASTMAVMVSRRTRAWVGGVLGWITERLPQLKPLLAIYLKLAASVGAYRHRAGALVAATGIALFTWLFTAFVNLLLSRALHPEASGLASLSLEHILIFNPMIGLVQLLPASIGGLGLNQNAYDTFYSQMLGYDSAHVVAVAFLMQLLVYVTSLPGGFLWFVARGKATEGAAAAEAGG